MEGADVRDGPDGPKIGKVINSEVVGDKWQCEIAFEDDNLYADIEKRIDRGESMSAHLCFEMAMRNASRNSERTVSGFNYVFLAGDDVELKFAGPSNRGD